MSGIFEFETAANVFSEKMHALLARKKVSVWEVPPGLNAAQGIPGLMPHFLSTL